MFVSTSLSGERKRYEEAGFTCWNIYDPQLQGRYVRSLVLSQLHCRMLFSRRCTWGGLQPQRIRIVQTLEAGIRTRRLAL